jgi:hypothetical protein
MWWVGFQPLAGGLILARVARDISNIGRRAKLLIRFSDLQRGVTQAYRVLARREGKLLFQAEKS